MHANELPLRCLIRELDGKRKGPSSFPGPIGQAIQNCVPLEGEIKSVCIPDHPANKNYIAEMRAAVGSGHVSSQLSKKDPAYV